MGFLDDQLGDLRAADFDSKQWVRAEEFSDGLTARYERTLHRFEALGAEPEDELPCGFQRWVAGICRRNVAVELGP